MIREVCRNQKVSPSPGLTRELYIFDISLAQQSLKNITTKKQKTQSHFKALVYVCLSSSLDHITA